MFFCIGNGAMNVQQYWQLRKECLANICYGATVFVAAFPIVNERWQSKKFFLLSIITDSLSSLCVACIFTLKYSTTVCSQPMHYAKRMREPQFSL
jgi:hypothetical protein